MDYTVHINNGSMEASPIVLRLLPGEETGFDLKVINHGEPSNVSLEASDSLLKAVRLKRPDSYVASEESIPVRVRMPQRAKRLEGEILLTSSAGSSSVPISLVRESDDYGGDSMDKGGDGDEIEDEGAHENKDEDEDEDRDAAGMEIDDEADDDAEGEVWKDKADGPSDAAEKIRFSREKDLERYRAASRSRSRTASAGASVGNSGLEDSGIGNSNYQGQEHPGDLSLSYDQKYLSHENEKEEDEAKAYVDVDIDAGRTQAEEQTLGDRLLSFNWERGSMQIVPAVVLLSIIAALVLTFYTESLPLFAGALASSILIVTLIIYGAATLLKA